MIQGFWKTFLTAFNTRVFCNSELGMIWHKKIGQEHSEAISQAWKKTQVSSPRQNFLTKDNWNREDKSVKDEERVRSENRESFSTSHVD